MERKGVRKMRRRLITLVLGTLLAILIAGGVALADVFTCTANPCTGTSGDDVITGTTGPNTIEAQAGNDFLYGLGNTDALYGGAGRDEIHGDATEAGAVEQDASWDALYGGLGADNLFGDAGVDVLYAGKDSGQDTLDGEEELDGEADDVDVYVVDRAAYKAGLTNPDAAGADVIVDETAQSLGKGKTLPRNATAVSLHEDADTADAPRLYFYR
jgi:Ca2+-binding RTX toxin-like protein